MQGTDVISVSQYLDRINSTLKNERAKVIGEVSGVQEYPGRSYLYFSLKDSKDQSTVKCFMWKRDYSLSGVLLEDGMEIVITAYPNIYKPNGGLTMQVELIELVGEGALKIAYDKLKKKLEGEGLLGLERKREIPEYPHRIGVITSKSGAVINDFTSNIGKFGFEILFVDSKVEGQDAVKDLIKAVETLKKKELDVLVIMRGGGSLESFQAFNNEILVRAVGSFPAPVLTGIGHDKDAPLVSLVSDKNVSTPTAVANLLNSSWIEALSKVQFSEEIIFSRFLSQLANSKNIIEQSIIHMDRGVRHAGEILNAFTNEILRGFDATVKDAQDFLVGSKKTLELSDPKRQLAYGYSITKSKGKILKSIKDSKKGDRLDILVSDGIIESRAI